MQRRPGGALAFLLCAVMISACATHRRQIMDKLRIYNVAGLVKYAIREGIVSLEE